MCKAERARTSYGNAYLAHRRPQRGSNPCCRLVTPRVMTHRVKGASVLSARRWGPTRSFVASRIRRRLRREWTLAEKSAESAPRRPSEPAEHFPKPAPEPAPKFSAGFFGFSATPAKNLFCPLYADDDDKDAHDSKQYRRESPDQLNECLVHIISLRKALREAPPLSLRPPSNPPDPI